VAALAQEPGEHRQGVGRLRRDKWTGGLGVQQADDLVVRGDYVTEQDVLDGKGVLVCLPRKFWREDHVIEG